MAIDTTKTRCSADKGIAEVVAKHGSQDVICARNGENKIDFLYKID